MHPPNSEDSECDECADPLWHSRHMLEHTCKTFSMRAHMAGVLSFDELSLGVKCRTRAIARMPNEPDKFGIRMHGLSSAGPECPPFLFCFVPNGAGNYSDKSLPEKHV